MRHRFLSVVIVGACIAIAPIAAQAQDTRVHFTLGAGFTSPNGEVHDRLGNGYNITFGVDVPITPVFAIEGLYSYNGLGEKRISVPVSPVVNPLETGTVPTDFFGSMNMQYFTGSLIIQRPEGGVRPYGLIGMGVYYRPVKITTPAVGYAPGYATRGSTSATRAGGFRSTRSSATAALPTSEWDSAAACASVRSSASCAITTSGARP